MKILTRAKRCYSFGMQVPELVAHRGYPARFPENTLPGIEAALRAGARWLEVDVQLSADQVPVLFHDDDLARVCGVDGAVHERSFARLRTLRASEYDRFGYRYADVRIAALAELVELLARYPEATAFIEIKDPPLAHFGIPTVLDRVLDEIQPVAGRCPVIAYSQALLATTRARGWPALGIVLERWRDRRVDAVQALNPDYLFCNVRKLPRWGRLHMESDAQLVVYDIVAPATAIRLAARGVRFIETFAIGEMLAEFALLREAT